MCTGLFIEHFLTFEWWSLFSIAQKQDWFQDCSEMLLLIVLKPQTVKKFYAEKQNKCQQLLKELDKMTMER